MDLKTQKRIAADILKCGKSRIRIKQSKEVEEALTRNDIRELIKKGLITKVQKKGTSRLYARKRLKQKKRGRRKGSGSVKGGKYARNPRKPQWIKGVRATRRLLRELRGGQRIEKKTYTKTYLMIKGGAFRNKKHLLLYLKERNLLKEAKPKAG